MIKHVRSVVLIVAVFYATCLALTASDRRHALQQRLYQVAVERAVRLDHAQAVCPRRCNDDDNNMRMFLEELSDPLWPSEMTQRREQARNEPQHEPGWLVLEMMVVTSAVPCPHAQLMEDESSISESDQVMDWDDMVHAFVQGLVVQEHQEDQGRRLLEQDDTTNWPPACLVQAWKEQRVTRDCSMALHALDEADRVRHDMVQDYVAVEGWQHYQNVLQLLLFVMALCLAVNALRGCCGAASHNDTDSCGCDGTSKAVDATGTYQPPVVIVKGTAVTNSTTTTTNNNTQTDCKCCCCGLDSTQLDSIITVEQACCDCCRGTGLCAPKCDSCCGDSGHCCDDGCCDNGCCSDDKNGNAPIRIQIV